MSDDPSYDVREARTRRYYAAVHVDRLLNSAQAAMKVADEEQAELRARADAADEALDRVRCVLDHTGYHPAKDAIYAALEVTP